MPELLAAKKDREFELIDRILGGHHEAFYELIAPYERRVFMTAFDILQLDADAEEVAQEAFLKAFRSLRSFRREAQFSTWLLRIAVNEARMRLRKRREISLESLFPNHDEVDYVPILLVDWREIPVEALLREETRQLLRESLAALPENYREIITLRDVNGLSTAEAAEILGLTVGNARVRLLRARIMLRDLFVERLNRKTRHRGAREVTP
ncbi:MAG TPA: sigma-70 family RNA polymerase sigma factor [Candidatus Acidoferrum sp.]|nr:sigma-70 family RNA polymerase sigma factor [Candidatus Acidoferrum sp.]